MQLPKRKQNNSPQEVNQLSSSINFFLQKKKLCWKNEERPLHSKYTKKICLEVLFWAEANNQFWKKTFSLPTYLFQKEVCIHSWNTFKLLEYLFFTVKDEDEEDFIADDEQGEGTEEEEKKIPQKKKKDKGDTTHLDEEDEATGIPTKKKRELYSELMINKTKIRKFYGVKERYLHKLWERSRKSGGFDKMLTVLEKRLATVIMRASFVMTIDAGLVHFVIFW